MWSHVLSYFSVTPSIVCTELEHPPPAAATYRAGDATLPRGHVQISPSKHFQKSSRFFSHWIWVRPPLGSKLAPQHFQPRLKNAAKWTVRAAGASPRPSREIANDETANSERAFVAQWSPTLNNMLQKETKYLSMMATSSQGGKKECHSLTGQLDIIRRVCVSERHHQVVLEMSELGGRPQRDELVEMFDDSRSRRAILVPHCHLQSCHVSSHLQS